jgi:hypothetical protein
MGIATVSASAGNGMVINIASRTALIVRLRDVGIGAPSTRRLQLFWIAFYYQKVLRLL